MPEVLTEITPLSEKDCFYYVDRLKDTFNYPLHRHDEFELNLVENADGALRIVGDSTEEIGSYDLVLVGHGAEHCWTQHKCISNSIREITIQFSSNLFGDVFLSKTPVAPIRKMLDESSQGLAFPMQAIMSVYSRIENLQKLDDDFLRLTEFMHILYELARSGYSKLSSGSFVAVEISSDSRRIHKVQRFINDHYHEDIRLEELASMAGMTPAAFSRFFKLHTGRSLWDYIIDVRMGVAVRELVDTIKSVSEISYQCGFNNTSHFHRLFKRKKGCTPKEFRELYRRHKILV